MHEEMRETERQYEQIKKTIKYLKDIDANSLCIKPDWTKKPENFVWISESDLNEIDLQPLLDKIKLLTITHLTIELDTLKKKYLKSMTNKLFRGAQTLVE